MEKIKVTGSLIELSEGDQLLTVDMKALVRVQRNKTGSEISILGGDVIDVDQDYEDIVKAWEDYYRVRRSRASDSRSGLITLLKTRGVSTCIVSCSAEN